MGPDPDEQLARFEAYQADPTEARRNALVEEHLGLARAFARRYDGRGVALDDLEQVARIALIGAVERFDPSLGFRFSTFAVRRIDGALKRHFRDRAWSVRVPRRAQELSVTVRHAVDELSQSLGRAPTPVDVADHLGVTVDEVIEATEVGGAFNAASLDRPVGDDGGTAHDRLGGDDPAMADVENEGLVATLLDGLSDQERRVVELRFWHELTQTEIAKQVGVSQMQVSRILARALGRMRAAAE